MKEEEERSNQEKDQQLVISLPGDFRDFRENRRGKAGWQLLGGEKRDPVAGNSTTRRAMIPSGVSKIS